MVQGDDVTSAPNERDSIFERTANRLCLPGQGASGQLRDHFAGARFLLGSKLFGCQENVAIDVECGAHASDVTTSNSCVNCGTTEINFQGDFATERCRQLNVPATRFSPLRTNSAPNPAARRSYQIAASAMSASASSRVMTGKLTSWPEFAREQHPTEFHP